MEVYEMYDETVVSIKELKTGVITDTYIATSEIGKFTKSEFKAHFSKNIYRNGRQQNVDISKIKEIFDNVLYYKDHYQNEFICIIDGDVEQMERFNIH